MYLITSHQFNGVITIHCWQQYKMYKVILNFIFICLLNLIMITIEHRTNMVMAFNDDGELNNYTKSFSNGTTGINGSMNLSTDLSVELNEITLNYTRNIEIAGGTTNDLENMVMVPQHLKVPGPSSSIQIPDDDDTTPLDVTLSPNSLFTSTINKHINNNNKMSALPLTEMVLIKNSTVIPLPVPVAITNQMSSGTIVPTSMVTVGNTNGLPHNNRKNLTTTKQFLAKIQKTAETPILNHIFDSHSTNKNHHHHDRRYGPQFEGINETTNVTNITVQAGSLVYLNCRISLLQDKLVSWVRRKEGENNLQLLTFGTTTYSGDARYRLEFQYPNNWRLKILPVIKDDEGTYECQISTYPPRIIQIHLHVIDPKVLVIDENGIPLLDKHYEVDSTMQLSCIVRHVPMTTSVVYWSHGDRILNYDTTRGGVRVKTETLDEGANSTLSVARVNKSDSGNYSCSINASHVYSVSIHVLTGESFAELHHGNGESTISSCIRIVLGHAVLLQLINSFL